MKKFLIILTLSTLILVNEFTLVYFTKGDLLQEYNLNKIRYFNLINLLLLVLIYLYWSDFYKLRIFSKILIIFFLFITVDYLSKYAGYGYGHSKSDYHRYIFPYDWIRGKPNVLDHNKYGFRGKTTPDTFRNPDKIVIGLFGGSTGYHGNPTILEIISEKLKKDGLENISINFSSVSSNHNQHLHRLLEFSEFSYDLIIFYGGGNETFQQLYYDPRPGYPYNFYMFENILSPIFYLTKYSNIIGELDKQFKISFGLPSFSNLNDKLQNPNKLNNENFKKWANSIKENYFETVLKSKKITENIIKPNKCNKASFLAIFQPLNVNEKTKLDYLINIIRSDLKKGEIKDMYPLKDDVKFTDIIHVDQNSKKLIADEIYPDILKIIKKNCS